MDKQEIVINELGRSLNATLNKHSFDKLFVLTDEHTFKKCLPVLEEIIECNRPFTTLSIGSGDPNKTIESLVSVWQLLSEKGATRHSLLINLGGGMITDLGGFAASTFKRGIRYINIPTTLLAMVDASVGGKTGINFNGLKNEIGVFSAATSVLIDTVFLKTLDRANVYSGYAEMLKHGMISTVGHWAELLCFDTREIDYNVLKVLIAQSVAIKKDIIEKDPLEHNTRKALNLGHTVGHAFESLALAEGRPVLHGYAVAWGLVCELYYSHLKIGFPKEKLRQIIRFVKNNYGVYSFDCHQYEQIYEYMKHDKKNSADKINFTLLADIGKIKLNETAEKNDIFDMLDFYRESMG